MQIKSSKLGPTEPGSTPREFFTATQRLGVPNPENVRKFREKSQTQTFIARQHSSPYFGCGALKEKIVIKFHSRCELQLLSCDSLMCPYFSNTIKFWKKSRILPIKIVDKQWLYSQHFQIDDCWKSMCLRGLSKSVAKYQKFWFLRTTSLLATLMKW